MVLLTLRRWSENKNLIIDNSSFDGSETLNSYRTWKYIAKTEVEVFVMVTV